MWYKLARKKRETETGKEKKKSDGKPEKCNKNTKARMDEKKVPDAQARVFEVEESRTRDVIDDSGGPEREYPGERARADRRWICIQAFRAHL